MSSLFRLGQVLNGRAGQYRVSQQIQETVWLAKNQIEESVIIKSVQGHFRVANERDVLRQFSGRSPHIRPILDEIIDPAEPTSIVLRHLRGNLLEASMKSTLNRKELKYVSKSILQALQVLHSDGMVHADVKLDNILVNFESEDSENRFTEVQLADMGSSYREDHKYALQGAPIGAPMWRSPECLFELPWNTKTDIWSFGTLLISLIYGGNFNIFNPPGVPFNAAANEEYIFGVIKRQFQFFGPVTKKFLEIASEDALHVIVWLLENMRGSMKPFLRITEREMVKKDKEFIWWFMKFDPRDRPTAEEILAHEWWEDE
ncbi:hypothetical protein N8I77_003535 [Diaporthe amygdali]|uniref:Protein kinase domain-containing protein n=1 Tax=Phomopsis amygdali TaxID=1214568 RepID=A0AAD9SJ13_PHOAM|nr:hypothetical protein N8I77_003535 [Diaporthe amygdali]